MSGILRRRCCCDCLRPQPQAIVTIAGSCNASCADAAATYTWFYQDGLPNNYFLGWRRPGRGDGLLIQHKDGAWCARIWTPGETFGSNPSDCSFSASVFYMRGVVLACSSGVVTGTIELPGILVSIGDCRGCTATVTFG